MDRNWARETVTANPLEPTQSAATWHVPSLVPPAASIPDGPPGHRILALQGAWRDVASRTSAFSALNPGSRQRAQEAAWHLLALAKLQMFQKAWELLPDVAQVDDPGLLGEDGEDECPWVVRWLHAELPRQLGRPREGLEALYDLFALAEQQLQRSLASGAQASINIWDRRLMQVAGSLMTLHLRARELKAALQWLAWADKRRPECPHIKSRIAYAQLIIGDITAAAATFQAIADSKDAPRGMVQCNKGLLLFSQSDFRGALQEFDGALAADPDNRMAGNNRAICRMYCCNLPAAIQSLEGDLRGRAGAHLQETVLLNLASMYELSSSLPAAEAKAGLAAWAARVAPHDFDMSCIRAS